MGGPFAAVWGAGSRRYGMAGSRRYGAPTSKHRQVSAHEVMIGLVLRSPSTGSRSSHHGAVIAERNSSVCTQ